MKSQLLLLTFMVCAISQNVMSQDVSSTNIQKIIGYDTVHHKVIFDNNNLHVSRLNNTSKGTSSFIHLTKDIDTSKDSRPNNSAILNLGNSPFAVLNNYVYYNANDGIHGIELWKSNGTTAGTKMVKDIIPGEAGSAPSTIVSMKGNIYFIAYTPEEGNRIWKSDGTSAATKMLTYPSNCYPISLVNVNGVLYIIDVNMSNEWEIWKSDGTDAGTTFGVNLTALGATNVFYMTAANNLLYFTAENNITYSNNELWRTDGTSAGTFMLKDIDPDPYGEGPIHLTAYKNKIFFFEKDGTHTYLWLSDGTTAGTTYASVSNQVGPTNINGSVNDRLPLTVAGNSMYFEGISSTNTWGIYKYSDVSGTSLVEIVNANQPDRIPISYLGTTAYFIMYNVNAVPQLWAANDATNFVSYVTNLPSNSSSITEFTNCSNLIFFNITTVSEGKEVWSTDGTSANTHLVKDINAGKLSSNAAYFTRCNNKTFFSANTLANGYELWNSDGTAANTQLVKDVNTTTTEGSNPASLTVFDNKIIFSASTDDKGNEPYISDGTKQRTFLIKDIVPGEKSSYPFNFKTKKDTAYFVSGKAIYKTDGAKGNTQVLYDFGSNYYFIDYTVTDNYLIFCVVLNYITGYYELWRVDGTSEGTYVLASTTSYNNGWLAAMGNDAYLPWSKLSSPSNIEIWKTDGTVNGTKILKDINAGTSSSSPHDLYVYGNTLYFGANNGNEDELWKTDGTTAATKKVKAVYPSSFHATDSLLFFAGNTTAFGNELWKTNGTGAGTIKVKDIYNGTVSSNPGYLNNVGNTLFFIANDVSGSKLWKSDGTGVGTEKLTDMKVFPAPSLITVAGDKLFFLFFDTTGNLLLAESDGTQNGTYKVDDSLLNTLSIEGIVGTKDQLFLSAYGYEYGDELYSGKVSSTGILKQKNILAQTYPNADSLNARLLTNPFTEQLNLNINSKINQQVKVLVTNASGNVYYSDLIDLRLGNTIYNINTNSWFNGNYFIHIFNTQTDAGITLNAIKVN